MLWVTREGTRFGKLAWPVGCWFLLVIGTLCQGSHMELLAFSDPAMSPHCIRGQVPVMCTIKSVEVVLTFYMTCCI